MLSSSYSFTPHTEIGKIQCIVHGFPQRPLQSQSHLCSGCPALLKDLRGQTGNKSESSPHQWSFSRHGILLLFCSRSMEDTRPLYVLVAMLNCSFSNLILSVRVEHCLPFWSHPAGTSCILRFSSSLAFQKPGPKTQPQRVLCWNVPGTALYFSLSHLQHMNDMMMSQTGLIWEYHLCFPFPFCIPALSLVLDLYLDLDRTCYGSQGFHQRSLVPFQAVYAILFLYSSLTFQLFLPFLLSLFPAYSLLLQTNTILSSHI